MKRSTQVALLLMGVTGVGATGYAMTRPPPNCIPQGSPAATMAPATPGVGANEPCQQRRSWSSSGGYGYQSRWTRTNSSTNSAVWPRPVFTRTATAANASGSVPLTNRSSTTTSPSHSSTTTTTRGGFGSTASSHSSSSSS